MNWFWCFNQEDYSLLSVNTNIQDNDGKLMQLLLFFPGAFRLLIDVLTSRWAARVVLWGSIGSMQIRSLLESNVVY